MRAAIALARMAEAADTAKNEAVGAGKNGHAGCMMGHSAVSAQREPKQAEATQAAWSLAGRSIVPAASVAWRRRPTYEQPSLKVGAVE